MVLCRSNQSFRDFFVFGLATVLAIFPKDLVIFYNHLVTLVVRSAGLFVCMSGFFRAE
jgi:hypothetical protein